MTENTGKMSVDVSLLGGFSLRMGDILVTDELNRSIKIWSLLTYLIVHKERNVTQAELIESLWENEDNANPLSALKTLLFRMRQMLIPLLGEDVQLITSQRGAYSWNRNITCVVDTDLFEEYCKQAANPEHTLEQRLADYQAATELYKGDFLVKLSGQLWIVPLLTRYHALYLETVKEYARLLRYEHSFSEMATLCLKAVEIDAYDEELHGLLIQAFLGQGNDAAALKQYEMATELLYRNLGIQPSAKLRELYREIMKVQKGMETDLGVIQNDLRETCKRPGPFFCEFGFFQEAYRLMSRQSIRYGACIHIALITCSNPDGSLPALAKLNATMDYLAEIISESLRNGDVVSRYSGAQYVIMLPRANYEDSCMVVDRIISKYNHKRRYSTVKLNWKVQQVALA